MREGEEIIEGFRRAITRLKRNNVPGPFQTLLHREDAKALRDALAKKLVAKIEAQEPIRLDWIPRGAKVVATLNLEGDEVWVYEVEERAP